MLKQRIGEYGPDSGGRVKGVTVIKPIVFGNQVKDDTSTSCIKDYLFASISEKEYQSHWLNWLFHFQARYFGKKREEDGHTHSWTVYVKPYHNDDMSVYVKKVHFRLHDSYANQVWKLSFFRFDSLL